MKLLITIIGILFVVAVIFILILPFMLGLGEFSLDTAGLAPLRGGARGEDIILISDNAGGDWKEVIESDNTRSAMPAVIYDFEFHPHDSKTMFLGGKRSGLWVSKDAGKNWGMVSGKNSVLNERADVYAIDINKSNPQIMYLAVFQQNKGRIFKSEDGGLVFKEVYFAPAERIGVFGVFSDPENSNKVYIITGQGGFLDSQNGGKTWRVRKWFSEPLPKLVPNKIYPFEMYIATASGKIFKTFDRGENWADLNSDFENFKGSHKLTALVIDNLNFTTVYHGSSYGLLRSQNGGFSWLPVKVIIPPEALPVNAVAVDPFNSRVIHMAASSQVYKSVDGGENWSVDQLPTKLKIKMIKINPKDSKIIYAILGR